MKKKCYLGAGARRGTVHCLDSVGELGPGVGGVGGRGGEEREG